MHGLLTCSIESTVGSTLHVVGAEGLVKGVASVAVGVATRGVKPAPVCVQNNIGIDRRALASSSTLLVGHGRMGLSSRSASLLSENAMAQSQKGCQSRGRDHCDREEKI